jgi:hypothetical protein
LSAPLFWVLYAIGAVIVGVAGRQRRIGFVGFLLLALLLTPPLVLLILILTRPKPLDER